MRLQIYLKKQEAFWRRNVDHIILTH
uniref:Uncharacterized protein n=1 Tax=Rhizophora mucronata TaxID=61149 RepID=A0A2P2NWP7_RHIMU